MNSKLLLSCVMLCASITPISAQTPTTLTTSFISNNAFAGNMFDITGSTDILITGFRFNLDTTNSADISVYQIPNTFVGSETAATGWTLLGSMTVTGNGLDNPSDLFELTTPFSISTGQTAGIFVIRTDGTAFRYINGTAVGNVAASDDNLTIYEGVGKGSGTIDDFDGGVFTTRVFSGDILYILGYQNDELFRESIKGADFAQLAALELTNLALNGAHHRTLMDFPELDGENNVWIAGDIAQSNSDKDADYGIGEVGVSHDFMSDQIRAGIGVGYGYLDQELAFGGESQIEGQYVLAEVNYAPKNVNLIYSLLLTYGDWDAEVERGYIAMGSLSKSDADVDIETFAARFRLDRPDFNEWRGISFSAYGSIAVKYVSIDTYNEKGGAFPAEFEDRSDAITEVRAGLTGDYALNEKTMLRGLIEGVHVFNEESSAITGTVPGFFDFDIDGQKRSANWLRGGLELTYLIGDGVVSASVNIATVGEDPSFSGGLRYSLGF